MSKPALLDTAGRRRSPATVPGFHCGRPPRNKGLRYPADPPAIEEIVSVMRVAGTTTYGLRTRALVVVLWRAGLRISEALALAESDLDRSRGSIVVRCGKGGKRVARSGWTAGRGSKSARGSRPDSRCPSVRCCASSTARLRDGHGHRQRLVRYFGPSRHVPACAGASPHISFATPTRSRWPAKGAAQRHSAAVGPREPRHHIRLPARHRQQRDRRDSRRPSGADPARERGTRLTVSRKAPAPPLTAEAVHLRSVR